MPNEADILSANSRASSDLSKTMFPLAPVNVASPSIVNPVNVPTDVMFDWAAPVTVAAVPEALPVTLPVIFPTNVPLILLLASFITALSAGNVQNIVLVPDPKLTALLLF